MAGKEKLGRSLQSLLGEAIGIETVENIIKVKPSEIQPSESQPRKRFTQDQMKTLVKSIQEHGVLQPIIVRPINNGYKIIAGERRWRAAKLLGLREVPVFVKNADNMKAFELALVENIQREDLNPIEKARGFLELKNKFGLTQEQIALRVGQDRSSVANIIRLLDLPEEVQDLVSRGTLSMGHARALLSLKDPKKQKILCNKIITDGISVREVEIIVSEKESVSPFSSKTSIVNKKKPTNLLKSPHILDLEDKLRIFIGTKVSIKERNGKGKIVIEFSNNTQFESIIDKLKLHMESHIL
ncbi:MAG: ParB/RepB/Spo0J family partition protein [Candidatus Scalinduaceae bacterium]